ncbi:MAG: sensor histidine kinase, partial [Nitrospirales bacterium]
PVLSGLGLLQANLLQFFEGLPKHEAKQAHPTRQLCDEVLNLMRSNTRRIKEQVREMANCVKGMTTPPQFETCDVNLVVRNVFDTLRLLADESKISLRSDGLATLPTILADERRLYLAFYNLVNNAIPEVPAGGSIVVKGWTDPKDDSVRITVTDTGRGMPAEVREKLFTPSAISRKEGGTGLGTKIVKDIVVAHGGEISVESEEGTGTTFLIRLPVRPNPDQSSKAAAEPDDAGALTHPPGSSPRSRP